MNTFDDLRKLEQGWDSYGANPIREEAIQLAEEIYKVIGDKYKLAIVPSPDGGVALESNDYIVEIFFSGDSLAG